MQSPVQGKGSVENGRRKIRKKLENTNRQQRFGIKDCKEIAACKESQEDQKTEDRGSNGNKKNSRE